MGSFSSTSSASAASSALISLRHASVFFGHLSRPFVAQGRHESSLDVYKRQTSNKGARFFRAHKAEKLLFKQIIGNQGDALKIEYAFKRLSRKRKESLIMGKKICYEIAGRKVKLSGITR